MMRSRFSGKRSRLCVREKAVEEPSVGQNHARKKEKCARTLNNFEVAKNGRHTEADDPRIKTHTKPPEGLCGHTTNDSSPDRHTDKHTWENLWDKSHRGRREQARNQISNDCE